MTALATGKTNDTSIAHDDPAAVRLQELTRGFGEPGSKREVLSGVSAVFAAGSLVALRGRSGSGKSTLLNLISGIDRPDSGDVWIDAHKLTAMTERERTLYRRRHIGFVYQAFNLVPTLSVVDNVSLVLELNDVASTERRDRVRDLLAAVGLDDRGGEYPDRLSGGEQQRVALARALANRPQLILADEPTGNLDEANADAVLELLIDMVRTRGATMIMATHSSRIAARCDRVVEIHDGRIVG